MLLMFFCLVEKKSRDSLSDTTHLTLLLKKQPIQLMKTIFD